MVTCDICHKEFIEVIEEKTKQLNNEEITKTFMKCPHCKVEYTICFSTDVTVFLQKQIKQLINNMEIGTVTKYNKTLKVIKEKQKKLKKKMEALQNQYEDVF